jgi:hypothetical protein
MSKLECCVVRINFMFGATLYKSREINDILTAPNSWAENHQDVIPLSCSEMNPNAH